MKAYIVPDSISIYTDQTGDRVTSNLVGRKRIIALVTPPILIASMYPIFNSLAGALANDRIAWYLGLATYWLVWGVVFPILMIGVKNIKDLIRPQKLNRKMLVLLAVPLIGATGAKLVPGMGEYEKESALIFILVISTAFGNGFFEEVLWRGVFAKLFPTNIFLGMIWPGIWFGIWHFIPVSINNFKLTGIIGMMIGSAIMALYLSYLTRRTNTLWWSILAHTIGGIIMVA